MEKNTTKRSMLPIFGLICVLYTCHIGPGFASGTQIVQYLVGYGWTGVFLFPIIVGLVSAVITYLVLEYARIAKTDNYRAFYNHFFGKYSPVFSTIKDVLFGALCVITAANVFATGGSLLNMTFGLSVPVGGTLCVIAVILLTMFGSKLVSASATVITVALILIILFIAGISFGPSWPAAKEYAFSGVMNNSYFAAALMACNYAAGILTYLDTGISMIGEVSKSRKQTLMIAVGSCALIILTMFPLIVIFAANMPSVTTESIPLLYALQKMPNVGAYVQYLYCAVALLAMISTGVGFLHALVGRYMPAVKKVTHITSDTLARFIMLVVIMAVAIFIGQVGVIALVVYGYGTAAFLNIPLYLIPFLLLIPGRLKKESKGQDAIPQ